MKVLIIMLFVIIFILCYEVIRLRKDLDRFKEEQDKWNRFTYLDIRRLFQLWDIYNNKLNNKK